MDGKTPLPNPVAAPTPSPSTPATPTPAAAVPVEKPKGVGIGTIIFSVIASLLVGGVLGYLAFYFMPNSKTDGIKVSQDTGEILLPHDAVQIQSCSDRRGKLFVKPADIPVGPVYMVHNDKVIGVEYMLSKDEFLQGQSYNELSGQGIKVNHVNIGLLSQGHEGYSAPHFHVDMYTISYEEADAIVCPKSASVSPTPIATGSAQPVTATPSAGTASSSGTLTR